MAKHTIRSYKKKDETTCLKLLKANEKNLGSTKLSDYTKYWVAENTQKDIVGMVGFVDLENGIGMLVSCVVAKNHRKKGLGKELLDTVTSHAKENGYRKVFLITLNPGMMVVAIKTGFVPEGTLKKHFKTSEDMYYFSYFIE